MPNAIESYKEAWGIYKANLKPFLLNGLVLFIITLLLLPLTLAASVAPRLAGLPAATISGDSFLLLALSTAVQLLLGVIIGVFTRAFYGVCDDVSEEKKVEWHALLGHVKRRWQTLAGISILQTCSATLLAILFMVLPFVFLPKLIDPTLFLLLQLALFIIAIPLIILVAVLFEPAYPIAFVEYRGTFSAVGEGFGLVRRNLAQFVLFIIISVPIGLLGVIPPLQPLLTVPLTSTALLLFYRKDREGAKPRRKKPAG